MLWLVFIVFFLVAWAVFYAATPAIRSAGRALARLTARSSRLQQFVTARRDQWMTYLPVAAIIVAGVLLAAWAGDAFLDLAELVRGKSPRLQQFDAVVHDWVVSHRGPGDTLFFIAMSTIGGPVVVGVIAGIVAIVLMIQRRWAWVMYLGFTALGGALLNLELKQYFARARPAVAEMLRQARGYSFPSGHAMGSTIVFGALAYLAYRASRSWSTAAAVLALALTLIVSVALSRVYLGVHWISDVVGGMAAGFVWVLSTTVAYETLRRIRTVRERLRNGSVAP